MSSCSLTFLVIIDQTLHIGLRSPQESPSPCSYVLKERMSSVEGGLGGGGGGGGAAGMSEVGQDEAGLCTCVGSGATGVHTDIRRK